ncbi:MULTISPECIES: serralysin family metalloprotease [Dickeya]|uniref:serralysin n=1 Tax=Dickeya aquatica TaxID=1401087 RepID=A0A375AAK9_9GAMM|nr:MULTISPECIES: serralysin family metalloprotease [Dickeya]SLM63080.1 Secreted alkaline metalloproteinase [Dickeya aquatica]
MALSARKVVSPSGTADSYTGIADVYQLWNYHTRGNGDIGDKPSYTLEQARDQITRGNFTWNGDKVFGKPAALTYSFLQNVSDADMPKEENGVARFTGFVKFNDAQMQYAKLALQTWADVANVTFQEVSDSQHATIQFGNYTRTGTGAVDNNSQAFGFYPGNEKWAGSAWFNYNQADNQRPDINEFGRNTLAHEIGHTLGLFHPGNYDASDGNPGYKDVTYAEDTRQFSIMSYWNEGNTGGDFHGYHAAAPLLDDIAAIQKLYGANLSTRTGDTVYGFHSNSGRDFYTATDAKTPLVFSVWDAGGNDTFDFSGYSDNQRISLISTTFSDVGGLKGNVSIAAGAVIENAIGGSGNDVIVGNVSNNRIDGGAGNDVIFGDGGADILTGGKGKDIFVYAFDNDSLYSSPDIITDFQRGEDRIDLSAFNKNHPLSFVNQFSGNQNEVLLSWNEQAHQTNVWLHLNGHENADFMIEVVGSPLQTSDFIV